MLQISILGAGSWGSALAVAFSRVANVCLWCRSTDQALHMSSRRTNEKHLPTGVKFSSNINITSNLADTLESDLIIVATPSGAFREIVKCLRDLTNEKSQVANFADLVWVCKGFEVGSSLLPHEILAEVCPSKTNFGALLGPSFAHEVALGLPTAIALSSPSRDFALKWIDRLRGIPNFRIYANDDIMGSELGAGVKNVMAIAVGIADGLQLGFNARAALITRGLSEIEKLVTALGGDEKTIYGLTGVGDLILTCTGDLSRNRRVGLELAQGKSINNIIVELGHVAEGINAVREVRHLSRELRIDMPIVESVYRVIYEKSSVGDEVSHLFQRESKFEFQD